MQNNYTPPMSEKIKAQLAQEEQEYQKANPPHLRHSLSRHFWGLSKMMPKIALSKPNIECVKHEVELKQIPEEFIDFIKQELNNL
jgi:hypothetical protein